MFLFHEIHVDDFQLEARADRATYDRARELVEAICQVAEAQGQRLNLRLRYPFAEAAWAFDGARNPVPGWEERGHEIGTHAHFRRVRRTKQAIDRLGVRDNRCVVPGLIRASAERVAAIMRTCRRLGFAWVTDQVHHRPFPYVGLSPWRPAPDFTQAGLGPWVFIDVSVNPMAWGLLEGSHERARQVIGLGASQFQRLLGLLDHHLDLPRPHPVTHFGVPIHEHQLARALDDYRPNERSLQAFGDYLAAAARRPVRPCRSAEIFQAWTAVEGAPDPDPPRAADRLLRAVDRRDLRLDGPPWLVERLGARLPGRAAGRRGIEAGRRGIEAVVRRARRPPRAPGAGQDLSIAAEVGPVEARVWRAAAPRAHLVVSVAGTVGGRSLGLSFLGLQPADLAARGWTVWLYDRAGTGHTVGQAPLDPGLPLHATQAGAVFRRAADEGLPVAWLSYSGGLIAALASGERGFVQIDAEAPADRLSLRPRPRGLARHAVDLERLERHHMDEVAAPRPWEPFRQVATLTCPYHRLQGADDHMHGHTTTHARALLSCARDPWLNGVRWTGDPTPGWPGRLDGCGALVLPIFDALLP